MGEKFETGFIQCVLGKHEKVCGMGINVHEENLHNELLALPRVISISLLYPKEIQHCHTPNVTSRNELNYTPILYM